MTIHKNYGFSLIELIFAMALGAMLLAGLMQIYLSVKSLYQTQKAEAALQENIRFSSYILTRNIGMAGYAGCSRLENIEISDDNNLGFNAAAAIQGFDSLHLPGYLNKKDVLPNTDVIVIQKADADETRTLSPIAIGAHTLNVWRNPAIKDNLFLLISNCSAADLFRAKNYDSGTTISAINAMHHAYQTGTSVVGRYEEIAYFVGTSDMQDVNNTPIYSLFMMTNKGDKEELFEGITSMHVKYGISFGGQRKIDGYYDDNYIRQNKLWENVASVVIDLTQQDQVLGKKSWKIYIKLRNRD